MSDDITRPNPQPAEELTHAFNALYVEASLHLEAGCEKVSLMNYLRRNMDELTHYQPEIKGDGGNFFDRFQPYALQHLLNTESPLFSINLEAIFPATEALLQLHRSRCPHEHFNNSNECFQCGKHKDDIEKQNHIDNGAEFTNDDAFTSETCTCADCGGVATLWIEDESTRLPDHDGRWADCENCDTITGIQDDQPRHDQGEWDDRSNGDRCCPCGEASIDQTGEFAPWCSADCPEVEKNGELDPLPCCDFHAMEGHIDGAEKLPCAKHQGGSNYAPEFTAGLHESNELFKSHVQHLIDTNGLKILEILEGWESVSCPACDEHIVFEREGNGVDAFCEECEVCASLDYVL